MNARTHLPPCGLGWRLDWVGLLACVNRPRGWASFPVRLIFMPGAVSWGAGGGHGVECRGEDGPGRLRIEAVTH
jgi:hypothetical protein